MCIRDRVNAWRKNTTHPTAAMWSKPAWPRKNTPVSYTHLCTVGLWIGVFKYFTSADIGSYWNNLNTDLEAIPINESELPWADSKPSRACQRSRWTAEMRRCWQPRPSLLFGNQEGDSTRCCRPLPLFRKGDFPWPNTMQGLNQGYLPVCHPSNEHYCLYLRHRNGLS